MLYEPDMNLGRYYDQYSYFPKFTNFIFGELAYNIRRHGYLEKEDFVLILLWKTQFFQIDIEKGEWRGGGERHFFFEADEEVIQSTTRKLFLIDHHDKKQVSDIISDLDDLRGVAYKAATAIMAVAFSDFYGVVDRHVENALGFKVTDDAGDSATMIFKMREIAMEQTRLSGRYWTPRMVDMALWVLGKEELGT